jgi:hypothetical protein
VAHPAFKVVTMGGIGTLLLRISIWAFLTYRMMGPEYNRAPPQILYLTGLFILTLGLDAHWLRLYFTNFKAHNKAVKELQGQAPPALFSGFYK